jgi:hypothetical protein
MESRSTYAEVVCEGELVDGKAGQDPLQDGSANVVEAELAGRGRRTTACQSRARCEQRPDVGERMAGVDPEQIDATIGSGDESRELARGWVASYDRVMTTARFIDWLFAQRDADPSTPVGHARAWYARDSCMPASPTDVNRHGPPPLPPPHVHYDIDRDQAFAIVRAIAAAWDEWLLSDG